jgi:hypothetical protein
MLIVSYIMVMGMFNLRPVYFCIFFIPLYVLALRVSGAICTHPLEHQLQSTAIGVCNLWKAELIHSIKRCGVIFFA